MGHPGALFKHTKTSKLFFRNVKNFDFQFIDYMEFYKYLLFIVLKGYSGDTR